MVLFVHLVTRSKARELGMQYYFTGNPCKHGHVAERRTSRGDCLECYLHRLSEYREKNADHISKTNIEYKEKNKERYMENYKSWLSENKEYKYEYTRNWFRQNPEKRRDLAKKWRLENPERARKHARIGKARRRGAEGSYTPSDVDRMMDMQKNRCAYCRKSIAKEYHVDHIVPVSKGGSNFPDNLQLLCPSCNLKKGAKDPFDWANENGRLL